MKGVMKINKINDSGSKVRNMKIKNMIIPIDDGRIS